MRIAHIGSKGLPSRGATERVVEAVATRHASMGNTVTVYGSRRVCSTSTFDGVEVIALPVPSGKRTSPVVLDVLAALHALWRGYDVVHVHGSENAFVVPLLRLRSRVVTTNHGSPYETAKWGPVARFLMRTVEGTSVRAATVATCVAEPRARRLSVRYGRVVRYVPNGLERDMHADMAAAGAVLADAGLEAGRYVMFAAARVDPIKGCLTLIRAMQASRSDLPLLVVGDLWHAAGHEKELRDAAEGGAVVFLPRLDDRGALLGLVAASALFVFPSTVEAMSMMLLEAVSTESRVLASDIPENLAVLPSGFPVFAAGDEADLARAIDLTLAEPDATSKPRRAAYAREMSETYDWDAIARQYMDLYRAD
jgi:glycosyltransferase involved in cell wall biosynthesis